MIYGRLARHVTAIFAMANTQLPRLPYMNMFKSLKGRVITARKRDLCTGQKIFKTNIFQKIAWGGGGGCS